MKEAFELIKKRLHKVGNYQRCPSLECWAHSSKDCDVCALKEIRVGDAIEIVNQVAGEYAGDRNVGSTDGWIPCSERLPDKNGEYLVWYDCGEENDEDSERGCMLVPFWTDIEKFGVYQDTYHLETLGFLDTEFYECETVIAWQPLPEPYQPKGE